MRHETHARVAAGWRRSARLAASLFVFASLLAPCEAQADKARRIRFGRGQTGARVEGRLRGMTDEAVYVLRAQRGQRMRVTLVRSDGPTRSYVVSPSGDEEGQPGTGVIFDGELTETGDYRIRVRQSSSGESWRGTFVLRVRVK